MPSEHLRPDPGKEEQRQQLAALPEGQFVVKRSNGTLETGWEIHGVTEDTNGNLRAVIVNRELGLTKPGVLASELLAWQPSHDEELVEDTVPRLNTWEHLETYKVPTAARETREELGAEALEHFADEVSPEATPEKSPDVIHAEETIATIIGENGKDGGSLGEVLRTADGDPTAIRAALDQKTGDPELRDRVLSLLRVRFHQLRAQGGKFHERPQDDPDNNEKSVPLGFGYEKNKYRSSEYVIRLALAKLDGTFDLKKSEFDTPNDLPNDHEHAGQHRQAADVVLESFMEEKVATKAELTGEESPELQEAARIIEETRELIDQKARESGYSIDYLSEIAHQPMIDTEQASQAVYQIGIALKEIQLQAEEARQRITRTMSDMPATADNQATINRLDETAYALRGIVNRMDDGLGMDGVARAASLIDQLPYDQNMVLELRSYMPRIVDQVRSTLQLASRAISDLS